MTMTRRDLLVLLATSLGGVALGSCAPSRSGNGRLLGGGRYRASANEGDTRYVLAVIEGSATDPTLIPLPFLPHGIAVSPTDPERIAVFEKIGPGACEIDLSEQRMLHPVETRKDRFFYGHGAYSPDAGLLYATETYLASQRGVIAVRDATDRTLLGEFPTYGSNPHDCQLIEGGSLLLITNGGSTQGDLQAPSVTYVDVNTEQLIERVPLDNHQLNAGHIARSRNGAIAVVSAPRPGLTEDDLGGVSLRDAGADTLISMREPAAVVARMRGEALSVAIHEPEQIVAVTHPNGNMVTFWSIRDNRLLRALDFERPRGVTLSTDASRFILSFGKDASVIGIDVETLKPIPESRQRATYITGSHLYNWDRLRAESLS